MPSRSARSKHKAVMLLREMIVFCNGAERGFPQAASGFASATIWKQDRRILTQSLIDHQARLYGNHPKNG
jgi:hypothetical protein